MIGSVRDDPWWHNRISSMQIIPDYGQDRYNHHCCPECGRRHCNCHHSRAVTVNAKKNFTGRSLRLRNDWTIRDDDDYWNDRISAIDVPHGFVVILYKRPYYRGTVGKNRRSLDQCIAMIIFGIGGTTRSVPFGSSAPTVNGTSLLFDS